MISLPKMQLIFKRTLTTAAFVVLGLVGLVRPAWAACTVAEIDTGLGPICPDPTGLVTFILNLALGTAGGIALLMVIYGGFKVLTSSGDPKAVMEGRETITSAIAGLLLILFSVALLKIIGVDILGVL